MSPKARFDNFPGKLSRQDEYRRTQALALAKAIETNTQHDWDEFWSEDGRGRI